MTHPKPALTSPQKHSKRDRGYNQATHVIMSPHGGFLKWGYPKSSNMVKTKNKNHPQNHQNLMGGIPRIKHVVVCGIVLPTLDHFRIETTHGDGDLSQDPPAIGQNRATTSHSACPRGSGRSLPWLVSIPSQTMFEPKNNPLKSCHVLLRKKPSHYRYYKVPHFAIVVDLT